MTILCFLYVEHPKIAQFAPGIKIEYFKIYKHPTVSLTNSYRQSIGVLKGFPISHLI